MKNIIYLFLSLVSTLNINHNILPSIKKLNLFENNKEDLLSGIDQRDIDDNEPTIEYLLYIHDRNRLYTRLSNPYISFIEKEQLSRQILNENGTMGISIESGGLLDDWNFEIL